MKISRKPSNKGISFTTQQPHQVVKSKHRLHKEDYGVHRAKIQHFRRKDK